MKAFCSIWFSFEIILRYLRYTVAFRYVYCTEWLCLHRALSLILCFHTNIQQRLSRDLYTKLYRYFSYRILHSKIPLSSSIKACCQGCCKSFTCFPTILPTCCILFKNMLISIIKSEAELGNVFRTARNTLVILDFYADWCPPCHIMDKYLKAISHYYRATVLKIDVNQFQRLADTYQVMSVPTFIFIKHGKKLDSFSGANTKLFSKKIAKYC